MPPTALPVWPGLSARAEAALGQAVLLASVPATARQAVPDAVLAGFAAPPPSAQSSLRNPWDPGPAPDAASMAIPSDPRDRAIASVTGLARPAPSIPAKQASLQVPVARTAPGAAKVPPVAARVASLAAPPLVVTPPATLPPRRIPMLPALPVAARPSIVAPPDPWGVRAPPPALPPDQPAAEPAAFAAPYDTLTAGALSGIAGAATLMRRNGMGRLRDPGAFERLADTIVRDNDRGDDSQSADAEEHQRLMQWCTLARQTALLRTRFGLLPWDPDQQPALAEALRRRALWLAERPPWPGRVAAADGLEQWLPLVDCAEALDLPVQGENALRDLGRALRNTAGIPLPHPQDMPGLARSLATQDAMATLHETTGLDPATEAGAARLVAMARGLETLPDLPCVDTEGAVDTTTLARLRRLDRSQAGDLDLRNLTGTEIPLLSRGLPVLAALDARRRYRLIVAAPPTA